MPIFSIERELTDNEKRIADQSKQTTDLGKQNANPERKPGLKLRTGPDMRHPIADRLELIRKSIPLQKKFFNPGERYPDRKDKDVRNLATALFVHCGEFFMFIERDGVEPTNNAAERALRCAVKWRKTSFGSRSARDETAMARLLTVTRTCRMQNRNSLDYLSAAVRTHRDAAPAPSLLSKTSTT